MFTYACVLMENPHVHRSKRLCFELKSGESVSVMDFYKSCIAFFKLVDRWKVRKLLDYDTCFTIADKYHLANVFYLFMKANFTEQDFTERNFHLALYLSHDIHEDIECFKECILDNILSPYHRIEDYDLFMYERLLLFFRVNCEVLIEKENCDSLFYEAPHGIWNRTRPDDHAGVLKKIRCYKCKHKYTV